MRKACFITITCLLLSRLTLHAQVNTADQGRKTPMMGWSSWNNFRININEGIIRSQADAMIASGMKAAGYSFVNVDDGYFGGRSVKGDIVAHKQRFPSGMKAVAQYIHQKGLKAGIYSDAGINTCGSYYDKDTIGLGSGLFGHERQDIGQMLDAWGYDFIKVDWCGGEKLELDEETTYANISKVVYDIKPKALYNVCRWKFPGKWVTGVANSWRISGDISNTFKSVMGIVDLNADLWKYAGPGHVNDMDMLQVGRGMTYDEDKTHFSMWCMLASPLLAGNDLTKMSAQTIEVLTNKEMIAIDQDPLVYQARRIIDLGDMEVWARPLGSTMSGRVAVALLNRSKAPSEIALPIDQVGLDVRKPYTIRNVWQKRTSGATNKPEQIFTVAPHGVVVLILSGTSKPYNIFQSK